MTQIPAALEFARIPASDVSNFLDSQRDAISAHAEVKDLLHELEKEAEGVVQEAVSQIQQLDQRIEREAEDIAEKSAQKFKAKQDAILATTALRQSAAITKDYACLEEWIGQAILSGVTRIIGEMRDDERWTAIIQKTLRDVKERWNLTLICHPKDRDVLFSVISEAGLTSEISEIVGDPSIRQGACCVKGTETFVEIDIDCQISALSEELHRLTAQSALRVGP